MALQALLSCKEINHEEMDSSEDDSETNDFSCLYCMEVFSDNYDAKLHVNVCKNI